MLRDFIVPVEFAFVDEDDESGSGEGFCVGGDSEEGMFIDHRGVAEFAYAVAFRCDHLAIFDDASGDAGNVELFTGAFDPSFEVGWSLSAKRMDD